MTVEALNKYLLENKDVAEKFSKLAKEAIKAANSRDEYPGIMAKIAKDLGLDVTEEALAEMMKSGEVKELTDEELENVGGGFLLFFPWWS